MPSHYGIENRGDKNLNRDEIMERRRKRKKKQYSSLDSARKLSTETLKKLTAYAPDQRRERPNRLSRGDFAA